MTKTNYKFSNLCGTVYKKGNIVFNSTGNVLFSSIGNQITMIDLSSNSSLTLPFENKNDIERIAVSPNNHLLISIDKDGKALLINLLTKVLLHKHDFKTRIYDMKFSPNGKFIAITKEKQIEIWNSPRIFSKDFSPFVLFKQFSGHFDFILSLNWARDSKFLISTSADLSCRIYSTCSSDIGAVLTGHHDIVLGAWFNNENNKVYTVSRDGSLFIWETSQIKESTYENHLNQIKRKKIIGGTLSASTSIKWKCQQKYYFKMDGNLKVTAVDFYVKTGLICVGFEGGVFGIWEVWPDFINIQKLSISQHKITSVTINSTGEWLAFGSSELGQLLVWEWQSETYVLKQQGHQHSMTCLDYSHDGQFIATGGDDGKVKIWSVQSGFCFVTFTDHAGPVKSLIFSRKKQLVFTASLDGTVRAFDLVRYRNFRVFTSPTPEQFHTVAVDPSGELVVASCVDSFFIYVWSVNTGRLLEILSGHTGPISCLAFSPATGQLVSGGWDKTARIWDLFARDSAPEVIDHVNEILALSFSPDGKVLVTSTLDGHLHFWDLDTATQTGTIEGRRDIKGGRSHRDLVTAANAGAGKSFTSLCFTSDGKGVLAGGNSKYVCLYDIEAGVLMKRFQTSHNLSMDGMQEKLNSKNMTEAGDLELIDKSGENYHLEDRIDKSLPGVRTGDMSLRRDRPVAKTFQVVFSPTGRAWAAASTQGLLIYSLDDLVCFDPFDLDMEVTAMASYEFLQEGEYVKALVCGFRLGEIGVIDRVYGGIPRDQIALVVRDIGAKYFEKLIMMLVRQIEASPRLEFHLEWVVAFFKCHAREIKRRSATYKPLLRALLKGLNTIHSDFGELCGEDVYSLEYLANKFPEQAQVQVGGEMEEGRVGMIEMALEM